MNAPLSRRTVLRGLGTVLSLPLLEAMSPRTVFGAAPAKRPVRMAFFFVPNGMHMPDFTPERTGSDWSITPTLEPIADFRDQLTVLSGLTLNGGRSLGDGPGDHARNVASYLTGAHPRKTEGADIRNGVSVDQLAAEQIGSQTRFASLELGTERSAQAGRCDSGYSCIYTSNMSWRNETTPVAKEIDPRAVFDRLFGDKQPEQAARGKDKRERQRLSVLDLVLEDARALQRQLGTADQQKLDEYLYAVRDIEKRISGVDRLEEPEEEQYVPDYPRPAGVPRAYDDHVRLLFDLMVLALRTDSTRVMTFMFTNAGSNRSYGDVGVRDGHHNLSHHGNDKEKQAKIAKINRHHMSLFAYLLGELRAVREGEGNLLDNCLLMYGSGTGDRNRPNHDNLPILLAGGGGGKFKPGRHIQYRRETPLTNLYLSMLDMVGASVDRMADSTGRLSDLT